MTFAPNVYSIILIISGAITLLLCVNIFRRYETIVRWFGFMMLGIAIWALSYGFELASSNLQQMMFWIKLEYLGISFIPAFWFLFIVQFTGKDKWLKMKYFILVLSIPLITLLLVWTNHLHYLHYQSVTVDNTGPFPLLNIKTGPWYIVHTLYFYMMLLWGLVLLFNKFFKSDPLFRKQNLIIIIATCIPWVANILYLMGFRPLGHIDSTPFAFTITVLLLSIGLVRFKLLDITPIAREKVLESMNEGIIVADKQERIVDLNREAKTILSIHDTKIIGKKLNDLLRGQPELFQLIRKGEGGMIQLVNQKHGETQYLDITLSPLYEEKLIYSGLIILLKDVTQRVNIENQLLHKTEQLAAMNKLKDRLFSIIAHDLRSPLINLNDIIKMLDEGMMTEKEFRSFVPHLSKNMGYTTSLLENLLFWSKSQLQGETIRPVIFNVKEVTDNILHLFENIIKEKELIVNNVIEESSMVYADRDMIQLVIRNLISNAVKFSNRGGEINISSEAEANVVRICIKDEGVGMSQPDLNKLFEMENFTTRGTDNEQGTGLGLILCKDFIEKNKGSIWVESEVGKGSLFCVEIPKNPII